MYKDTEQIVVDSFANIIKAFEGELAPGRTIETPERACRALEELLSGYKVNIKSLFKTFDGEGKDQLVIAKNIKFTSLCEHHLLIFEGMAHVGYIPVNKVIGASKLPRLVHAYAKRLQLQERIAQQVADSIMEELKPIGVAVVMQASHSCMRCRGVNSSDSLLVNSVMLGKFRTDASLRSEFLALIAMPDKGGK